MNPSKSAAWKSLLVRHETILLLVLLAEWLYFYFAGTTTKRGMTFGFGSLDSQVDILRHSAEIWLLALVMTPIILTGGIDLSVGSTLGLCSILFGILWQDLGLAPWAAALCTIGLGGLAGGINAGLITGLRLPPLIVTLGTFSLFRGLAEALLARASGRGMASYTGFPQTFLDLGQGRLAGLPTQAWLLLAVTLGMWALVHGTTWGRSFRAIGFSPEGARYAGLPVQRRIAFAYILAGLVAGLAAVIYTSRLGQAKADAGTGYELYAITAVVLGGTSIFGGVGSIYGTLLGVAAIAVLTKGLVHIGKPGEVAGLLTGALLLLVLAGGTLPRFLAARKARSHSIKPTAIP